MLAGCDRPLPKWIPIKEWLGMAPLGVFDLGAEAKVIPDAPFGGNMAFRRTMLERYGLFRMDLGPSKGNAVRFNEDTEFGRRLLNHGEQICYEPSALLFHAVPPERLTKAYFIRWWWNKARSDAQSTGKPIEWYALLRRLMRFI